MEEYGLDLSVHNGSLDFDAIKNAGHTFVILRAGYGTSTKDSKFDEYYAAAKKVGLKVGAYWYSYALNVDGAKTEAKKMLEVIRGKTFEFPIYIDMEDADGYKKKNGMPSNSMLCSICNTFCEYIESKGYYVGIYASESWFNNQLKNVSKAYDKWVANWGKTNDGTMQVDKSGAYNLHQYTSNYYLDGKRFDRNISYLDYANVIKKAGLNGLTKDIANTSNTINKKTVEEIAKEVIAGKWGNGDERKQKLTNAGYNYNEVQTKVNALLGVNTSVSKSVSVGSKVTIKSGAVYGGLSSARGKAVPSYVLKQTHTVSRIQTNKGIKEALLKEINSWVSVSSLIVK